MRHLSSREWLALVSEFQTQTDPEILERILEYGIRVRRERRLSLDDPQRRYLVAAGVVNLTGELSSNEWKMQPSDLLGAEMRLKAIVKNLCRESAKETLGHIESGQWSRCLLPWIPLMRDDDQTTIVEKWKTLAQAEPDSRNRSDYGGLALVFAELTRHYDIWKKALEGWNMRQSQQVLEWRQEGRLEGEQNSLLRMLRKTYPEKLTAELENKIKTFNSDRVALYMDAFLDARDWEHFLQLLAQAGIDATA